MGITVRLAETEEDREKIYRLRYEIYIQQMQLKQTHADHERRTIKEPYDDYAYLFMAEDNGETVGTLRVNLRPDGPLEFEELYHMEEFKPYYPNKVAMCTKFMVRESHRNTTVASMLSMNAYVFNRERGMELNFIDVKPHLVRLYQQMGYRLYMENFHHPDFGDSIPMVFHIGNLDYLNEISSPFRRMAKRFPDSPGPREHFAKNFKDYDHIRPLFSIPADLLWERFSEDLNKNPQEVLTFLKDFSETEAKELIKQLDLINYHKGDVVIKEGTESNGMFCILSGQVEVRATDSEGNSRSIAVLNQGDIFGEIGFIARRTRTASIVVKTPARILVLSESEFKKLVKNRADLAIKLITNLFIILVKRFNEKSQALTEMKNHVDRLSKSLEVRLEGMDEQIKLLYEQENVDEQSASRTMKDVVEPKKAKTKTKTKTKTKAKKSAAKKSSPAGKKTAKKPAKKKTAKTVAKKKTKPATKKKAVKKAVKKAAKKSPGKKAGKKTTKKVVKKAAKKANKKTARKKR